MSNFLILLRKFHSFYNKNKFLKFIFSFLFIIRNQKYLKFIYLLIKWTINSIGTFVVILTTLLTDPVGALYLVIDWLSNYFDKIIIYIQSWFYWFAYKIEDFKIQRNKKRKEEIDEIYRRCAPYHLWKVLNQCKTHLMKRLLIIQ